MNFVRVSVVAALALIVHLGLVYGLLAILPIWLAALAVFVLIYAAHTLAIDGRVPWFVPLLVLSGLAGAVLVMQTQRQLGALLVAAVLVPYPATGRCWCSRWRWHRRPGCGSAINMKMIAACAYLTRARGTFYA